MGRGLPIVDREPVVLDVLTPGIDEGVANLGMGAGASWMLHLRTDIGSDSHAGK